MLPPGNHKCGFQEHNHEQETRKCSTLSSQRYFSQTKQLEVMLPSEQGVQRFSYQTLNITNVHVKLVKELKTVKLIHKRVNFLTRDRNSMAFSSQTELSFPESKFLFTFEQAIPNIQKKNVRLVEYDWVG